MTRPVLITGATGFVGSAVARQSSTHPTLRISRRGRSVGDKDVRAVDITHRSSLLDAARGAGSIVHCASYVGPEVDYAWHVNDEGTRVVVEVAEELGIQNVVYISTTGVYGAGAHRESDESTALAPASETSRSRLSAERRVLAAGGSVIRPHLIYGAGDRWFIPRLVELATLLGGVPRRVKASTISVDRLAQQVWMLHDFAAQRRHGEVHNALHDVPVTLRTVLLESGAHLGAGGDTRQLDARGAREALLSRGVSLHQVDMLTSTNTFSSNLPAELAVISVPEPFALSPAARSWYSGTSCCAPDLVEAADIPEG